MQPKTEVKLDKESFNRIKKTALNMNISSRKSMIDKHFATELPEEVGLQLTYRCNLRCKHCFEWSDDEQGYNRTCNIHNNDKELPIEIVRDVLIATEKKKSNLFLWGGEPLVYNRWDELIELLDIHKRWTVLCTNGINIDEKIDGIIKISSSLAILTSIEGFEKDNDIIRGKGTYKNVIAGIKNIIKLQKENIFKGKQSVHCTINDDNIKSLYEFALFIESLGVDTLYLCFPWFIPENIAYKMDQFYQEKLSSWGELPVSPSWHSFGFHIDMTNYDLLKQQLKRINTRCWKMRIRYQPALELSDIKNFIEGSITTAQRKRECHAIRNRVDVLADGSISACKLFQEFNVGNLHEQSLEQIWQGERFNEFRGKVGENLMPVCSKCILLYLNGK